MLQANQLVNLIRKYLYKGIDGAYKYVQGANMCDVFMVVYFQAPIIPDDPSKPITYGDVNEMTLDINITTYQNKIRVNVIELTPQERTIGHKVYAPEEMQDMKVARYTVLQQIIKQLYKAYNRYEFIF